MYLGEIMKDLPINLKNFNLELSENGLGSDTDSDSVKYLKEGMRNLP